MKKILRSIPFLCLFVLSFNASALTPKEITCPSLSAIKAEGLSEIGVISYPPLAFAAFTFSEYDSEDVWGFVIEPIFADSDVKAMEEAKSILSQMSSEGVVIKIEGEEVCKYETNVDGVEAFAGKLEFGAGIQKFSRFLKK